MIGTVGIVAKDSKRLAVLSKLDGREAIGVAPTRHVADWFGVLARDGDRTPAVHVAGDVTIVVVGDLYDADGPGNAAAHLRRVFDGGGAPACSLRNGSYAYIIADERTNTLHLGVDQNAFIPVYYAVVRGALYWSWDIAPVLAQLPGGAQLDEERLMTWLLVGGRGFGDTTRFRGVARLEPGACLTFTDGDVRVHRAPPFHFSASMNTEDALLDEAVASLTEASRQRFSAHGCVTVGVSGGLDSRTVLAAARRAGIAPDRIAGYTHGIADFAERDIARRVCAYYGIRHTDVVLEPHAYLDSAMLGITASSGLSLFKLGAHVAMHRQVRAQHQASALCYGSALDLMLASTHTPDPIYELKDRAELLHFYETAGQEGDTKNYLRFNCAFDRFERLCVHPSRARMYWDAARETLAAHLAEIPGEHPADINDAFAMEVRIKRWYNVNLIYALLSNRLLTPTYDLAFQRVVQRVPWQMRRGGAFRRKLLLRLDAAAAEIPLDSTMQPAWLPAEHAAPFVKLQQAIDREQQRVWLISEQQIYLPSRRFDANFTEWFRVHDVMQQFLTETLCGPDAVLADSLFSVDGLMACINDHIAGRTDDQKFLQLLVSAELCARAFVRGDAMLQRIPSERGRAVV